jgi:diguanylate cyclase (GGDEF)-like protein
LISSAAAGIRGLIETADKLFETSKLTMIDPLMGIYNRRFFDFELIKTMEMRQPLALAIIDIDHFKQINDTFGHVTGDKVLRELARILKNKIRNSDHLIRYGGEEIAIIFNLSSENNKSTTLRKLAEFKIC